MHQAKRVIQHALVVLLCLFCTTQMSAQQSTVTISLENVPLKSILKSIESQTNLRFSYKSDLVDKINSVSVHMVKVPVTSVLDAVLPQNGLEYSMMDKNTITISAVKKPGNFKITGKVVDSEGEPIIGASVIVKGTSTGTSTDADGLFAINGVSAGKEVNVSFIGYKNASFAVKNGKYNYDITLTEDSKVMDEVVVIGYGTTTKRDVTAAMGTYKPDVAARKALSADDILQGRVAGVSITSASGVMGSKNRVSIRGIGSITAGNEPLYVIDGVPITNTGGDTGVWGAQSMNGLDDFNPADIESIQVLKDAASAAIYGSRATNGVILITTKQGKKNQNATVTIDANVSFSNMARKNKLKMADTDLFLEVLNEAIDNYNIQTGSSVARMDNPAPGKAATDWIDLVTRTGVSFNTNVAIAGGNNSTDYYISGSYKRNEGVIIDNSMNLYNLKSSINTDVKKWLSVGTTLSLSYNRNNRIPSGYSIGTSVITRAAEQRPWDDPVLPNGEWAWGGQQLANHNPVQAIKEEKVYLDNYRAMGNVYLLFNIIKNLTFKTTLAEDFNYKEEYIYYTNSHPYGNNVGRLYDARKSYSSTLWENVLNYSYKFDKGLNLAAMLGYSIQKDVNSTANQTGIGFPSPSFDVNSVAAEYDGVSTGKSTFLLQSFFGRLNFNYKDRYMLTATLRADGSSKFYKDNRYGWFPSVSAGWNVGEEPWWSFPQTDFKIRASYGRTGNQGGIGSYAYMAMASGGYNYNGNNGIGLSTAGNRNLKWEKAEQGDVGIDLAFFNYALTFSADAFIKDTKDLLYSKPTAATTGYTSQLCNIGSMRNRGLEFTIGGNARFGEFTWHCDFNISFIRNKLTALLDDNEILTTDSMHALKVGKPLGAFYMIKWLGIYQRDEDVPESFYKEGVRAGDCIYEDVNGDGVIDNNDRQFVGDANPNFSGGFNNTFQWKGLDLNIFFTFSQGNKLYELWTGGLRMGNGTWPMTEAAALSRWTGEGSTNKAPRAIYGYTWNSTKYVNTRNLHDASYIRCRTISLGYTMPKKWMKAIHVDNMRVYFQADNLFIITRWPFLDPEVNVSLDATQMGYDYLYLGQPRTFTIGANIKF